MSRLSSRLRAGPDARPRRNPGGRHDDGRPRGVATRDSLPVRSSPSTSGWRTSRAVPRPTPTAGRGQAEHPPRRIAGAPRRPQTSGLYGGSARGRHPPWVPRGTPRPGALLPSTSPAVTAACFRAPLAGEGGPRRTDGSDPAGSTPWASDAHRPSVAPAPAAFGELGMAEGHRRDPRCGDRGRSGMGGASATVSLARVRTGSPRSPPRPSRPPSTKRPTSSTGS